jgi:hypothetical protein
MQANRSRALIPNCRFVDVSTRWNKEEKEDERAAAAGRAADASEVEQARRKTNCRPSSDTRSIRRQSTSWLSRPGVFARYGGGGAVDVAEAAIGAVLTEGPVHV